MHTTWQDWLATQQARTGARLLTLALVVLVIYQLARLTWQLVPAPDVPPAPATPANVVPSAPAAPERDRPSAANIAGWHLFGQADPGTGPGVGGGRAAPIDAPETRLNLTLRGLFATEDPERARAIIAAPNGEERSYRVEDELPGGAELSAIYADRIILQRNGRYETLRLPRESLEGGAATGGGAAAI